MAETTGEVDTSERLSSAILAKEPHTKEDVRKFLGFLRTDVSAERLLNDRLAQAFLDVILWDYRTSQPSGVTANPYPVLEYDTNRNGWGQKLGTFMLEGDDEHLYFLDDGNPIDKVPVFLRPQDVVPLDDFDASKTQYHRARSGKPFNKPLERGPIKGGVTEFYNYNTRQWETNKDFQQIVKPIDEEAIKKASQLLTKVKQLSPINP